MAMTTTKEEEQKSSEEEQDEDEYTDPEELPIPTFEFFEPDESANEEEQPTAEAVEEQKSQQQTVDDQMKHGVGDQKKLDKTEEFVHKRGLSYFAVLLTFLKSLIGAGFLALPMAFREAGIWAALVLLITSAFLNWICMEQLVECTQFHYRRLGIPFLSYGNLANETCKSSFPWMRRHKLLAKRLVNGSILLLEFGFCSTYYLFIATNLNEVLHVFWPTSLEIWLALIYVPMVLLTFVRSLRILTFISLVGNVLMFMSLFYIIYVLVDNLMINGAQTTKHIGNFSGILIASSTMIFSFEAQTLVLPLEKKLKKPQQMLGLSGILSSGIFIATCVYGSVGFLGYLSYGSDVKGSITQNLGENVGTVLVKLALCVSICSCFLLQMYVIVDVLWSPFARIIIAEENYDKTNAEKDRKKRWWQLSSDFKFYGELCFRALMVSVCFTFAIAVPKLDNIIPLVGSTSGMLLAFVFPSLIDLFTFVPHFLREGHSKKAYVRLCQNILFASVGLFGMVAGLVASISALINVGEVRNASQAVINETVFN